MTSRSVRYRQARRRTPAEPGGVRVTIELKDFATGISQSFLILPGAEQHARLTGYLEGGGLPRVLTVPLAIRAHLS